MAWLGKKLMQRMQRNFSAQQGFSGDDPTASTQNNVNTKHKNAFSKTREKKIVGEYIDFEEID